MASVTWAVGSVGYARLVRTYSAFALNFSRALIALPLFILSVFFATGGWKEGWDAFSAVQISHVGWLSLSMFASYGVGDVLFLWSARSMGVPAALAIASLYPIWTAGAGFLMRHETLSIPQCSGLITAVLGVSIVILNGNPIQKSSQRKGILLAFATSVLWAINSIAVAEGSKGLNAAVGNSVRMILAMGLSFSIGKILEPSGSTLLPSKEIMRFYWLFVLEAFAGSYFFVYGLSHSSLSLGPMLSSLAPVVSVPFAWAIGLERFSFRRTFGVALVVLGLCLLVGIGSNL